MKPSKVMRFFEEADDDNSGEINVDEFITVIKSILARIAEGTFDEEEIKDSREEIRIISEEEEALLNVWAIVTNRSTGNILKKRMLRLIETNFKARRLLRRVHPDFETASRQSFLRHSSSTQCTSLWGQILVKAETSEIWKSRSRRIY